MLLARGGGDHGRGPRSGAPPGRAGGPAVGAPRRGGGGPGGGGEEPAQVSAAPVSVRLSAPLPRSGQRPQPGPPLPRGARRGLVRLGSLSPGAGCPAAVTAGLWGPLKTSPPGGLPAAGRCAKQLVSPPLPAPNTVQAGSHPVPAAKHPVKQVAFGKVWLPPPTRENCLRTQGTGGRCWGLLSKRPV
ncbi:hypothetical protein KIL84_022036 [Mauremys mutica]|uniref:Uncharacterized protein n=1 Tax=Mauremys mutica TaxID=74926 RepID=A0A9D3XHI6_9SAUR|nr:hypothetical protein KIL84_022036 [Mauremys mutica]